MRPISQALTFIAALMVCSTSALPVWAPLGPVNLFVAFRVGGGADTQARLIADEPEGKTGWKFIPEQVTGKVGLTIANELNSVLT